MTKQESDVDALRVLRAEVATLRRKLVFLSGVVDALPFPVFWKDLASRYVGGNREQAVRCGLREAAAVEGLRDEDLPWTAEETARFTADDRKVLAMGEPLIGILETQRTADGGERLCETHKAPLRDEAGQLIGTVGWYEDVTEREAQRRLGAELEERLREAHKTDSVGVLARGIAHDFNNIVAAIMANLFLVRESIPTEHPAFESLEEIRLAGARAKDLVEQLLTLSSRHPRELRPMNLGEVALEVTQLMRAAVPADIGLSSVADADLPRVLADATQMRQIVMNLCTNAWQALEDRPSAAAHIAVRVTKRDLDPSTAPLPERLLPGAFVVLSVQDNGVGMDPATRARMFEPFFTSRVFGRGAGLGLSVVQGIVATHHGAIEVDSAVGRGTTVRVYLPQMPEAQNAASLLGKTVGGSWRPPTAARHVMYVDDEPQLVTVVKRLLKREGCSVTAFTDPREALAALRAAPESFDLLVVDFNMPYLSGIDLAREASALRAALPVVIFSGNPTPELYREALSLGVSKVVNKVELASELRRLVASLPTSCPTRV
jgi:signal transduction histidine kinase